MADTLPILLFGAFDRHNVGDLLFPHIATALLPGRTLRLAGLAARDWRPYGGHRTEAISAVGADLGKQPLHLLHVGGELLTCDSWQAAVMLQSPQQAQEAIRRFDTEPLQRRQWAQKQLGCADAAPYCADPVTFSGARQLMYCGVGGVDLAQRPRELREEVLRKLGAATVVAVRDKETLAYLRAAAVAAALVPDPAVMVRALFEGEIAQHGRHGEVAQLRAAFPAGYLAVQLSADFGDDATLRVVAAQLDAVARASGLAIVLFRAGAAPWHDDLECYRRLAAHMRAAGVWLFNSLHLWDVCALVAHSRAYCGSSLHGRIVATAFGLPRVNVRHPAQAGQVTKQDAYCATWEQDALPRVVAVDEIAAAMTSALASSLELLQEHAAMLTERYRAAFGQFSAALG